MASAPSPSRLLARELKARKVGKSELARRIEELGLGECKYYRVHRWTERDSTFSPDDRKRAALGLGLPMDYFDDPIGVARRQGAVRAVLDQFLATKPVAALLSPAEVDVLRSIRFDSPELPEPSVAFFESVALVLRGMIRPDEVRKVADVNSALDRSLADKPPLRRKR